MARPRRARAADAMIAEGMASYVGDMSARARARLLARRVVAEVIAEAERVDPMEVALMKVRLAVGGDHPLAIATCPDLDLASELENERVARFRARGCRQLSPDAWAAETAAIAEALADRLAERFRRCSFREKTGFLPKRVGHLEASSNPEV